MAEGGEFGYYYPEFDDKIDKDDGHQEVDTTRPFEPGAASTPYHGWEQHEMQTMRHERSGLPDTSYEETPLLGDEGTAEIERRLAALRENSITGLLDTRGVDVAVNPLSQEDKEEQIRRVKRLIKARYPNANVDRLVISYSAKKPMDIVVKGPKGGETKIVLDDGSDLQRSFLDKAFVKKELGPPARDLIQKTSSDIRKKQKELKDLRTSEQFLRSKDEAIQTLNERLNREQAKIDQLKENQAPDYKEEIKRKEQLLKNLKKDLKTKQKEREELKKKRKPKKTHKIRSTNFNQVFLKKKEKEMPWKKGSTAQKLLML